MPDTNPSPDVSATQQPSGTPATGTPAQTGATPAPTPALTLEEALKKIADLEHKHTNATEEVERHRKKLTAYEKAEKERETAAQAAKDAELSELDLTKKNLATLQEQHEQIAAELYEARVFQDVSRLAPKFNFLIGPDTLARMLLLDDDAIEMENGKPSNIEKLLDQLAKREPDLIRKAPEQPAQQQGQQQQRLQPPAVPAMNPGRAAIPAPGTVPAGRRPSLAEAHEMMRQQRGG